MRGEEEMYKIIGHNIFYYRLREKLTIHALSEKITSELTISLTPEELQEIEIGSAIMEVGQLLIIAEALKINIEKLLQQLSFYEFLADFGKERVEHSLLTVCE